MTNDIWSERIGILHGELTMLAYIGKGKSLFKCSCGNECIKRYGDVVKGKTLSCGHILKSRELTGLEGLKYGMMTAIENIGKIDGDTYYLFECDCGKEVERVMKEVKRGKLKSCGCNTGNKTNHGTHHLSTTKLYNTLKSMRRRCYNDKDVSYIYYGGRGVEVYEGWLLEEEGIYNFIKWSMDNGFSSELSIDRIDVNGNYEPSNCRWADNKTQANNIRNNLNITHNGVTKTLAQWCEELELIYDSIWKRLYKYNYTFEKAITYKKENVSIHKNVKVIKWGDR